MLDDTEYGKLQELHRQITVAMANLNDIEKTVSRLRNEVLEINKIAVDKLNSN